MILRQQLDGDRLLSNKCIINTEKLLKVLLAHLSCYIVQDLSMKCFLYCNFTYLLTYSLSDQRLFLTEEIHKYSSTFMTNNYATVAK